MIKSADEEDIYTVHQLMLEAFEEYRNLDVPSSALNETASYIVQSIKCGSELAILYLVDDVPDSSWITIPFISPVSQFRQKSVYVPYLGE